ncbi:lipocalin-like domain-containing protein [Psychromonas aquimarina]|uniref:lipocalin-like domain-containing protein n=1 Tax=Psychromonas aquimarina TaxID=444919 RepID=UPI000425BB95|nr:lipocalin-like domain-containing protein [Psychromonas aquimarina]
MNVIKSSRRHFYLLLIIVFLLVSGLLAAYLITADLPSRNPLKKLADDQQQYTQASAGNNITFPKAHSPHKGYRHEWWYLTTNLTSENGQRFASQWTLFRTAVNNRHWYFAHAALADTKEHLSAFRNGREELGNVEVSDRPFRAVIDDWIWQSSAQLLPARLSYGSSNYGGSNEPLKNASAQDPVLESEDLEQENWQVKLSLSSSKPFYLQGNKGFSKKHHSEDIASHYYSQPFIDVKGEILWQGKRQRVTGNAWFDREWGSSMLAQDQQGWDWFSLRLSKDKALMIYRIRSQEDDFLYGSLMHSSGKIDILEIKDINLQSRLISELGYPQAFTLKVESQGIDINIDIINNKQIMRFAIEYFEGMVTFNGSHTGQGFVEMTGYN